MKKFVNKFLIFVSPFIIFILFIILIDAYKVFGSYDNYYDDSFIELNREMVTTRTYYNYREEEKFNSFIFGSSRSQAFKTGEWVNHLDTDAKPFHFDAHGEGIYGIAKKIQYIDSQGDSINNALIIVDRTILSVTENRIKSHLYISPPSLTNQSTFQYYFAFVKGQINYKFLLAYVDFSFFKKNRDYMDDIILNEEYPNTMNIRNCDIWYGNDQAIKNDSVGYYKRLFKEDVFYDRPITDYEECHATALEIIHLNSIKKILDEHATKYKIIISPNYDQIPLEEEQIELLNEIFGKKNVYNFSGKNMFTDPISNFYEDSHYRPVVANEILKEIYSKTDHPSIIRAVN